MQTPLLVITADLPLGDLLRRSLEETGRYLVGVTGELEAAREYAREVKPALTLVDASMPEQELFKIGSLLRQGNPNIVLIVMSDAGWHSALEELFPRDVLSKPVSIPDLLAMVVKHLPFTAEPERKPSAMPVASEELPWLRDVSRAAQHLTRLTLESSAQAALINHDDQLWAYAGQLRQPAAHEISATLSKYWDRQEQNDLVRFIRLTTTNAEHMMYASRLAEGMVLALVFDAETPFSTIRTQVSQLARSLATSPSDDLPGEDASIGGRRTNSFSDLISGNSPSDRRSTDPRSPGGAGLGTENYPEYPQVVTEPGVTQPTGGRSAWRPATAPRTTQPQRAGAALVADRQTGTAPVAEGRKIILEPITPAIYNLDYACVLVPRFPQHFITGDLLDRLGEWVPQICIAYAWRLEYISVRPEYLGWVVNVPPVTAPAHLMRVLRQQTSERIFSEFPRFKKENPSGEFWAPGYLIMGGSQPPPAQLIKDFITQTRQKQGIFQINQ